MMNRIVWIKFLSKEPTSKKLFFLHFLKRTFSTTVFELPNRFKNEYDCSYVSRLLKEIEFKWKDKVDQHWKKVLTDQDSLIGKNTKYILSMFPYPSGQLHLGHVRIYTTADLLFKTSVLNGENVVNPMGFDSFGLPAENAARLHNENPLKWTQMNIEQMRTQLNGMGYHFHWRESTHNPSYYRWTQWLFLELFKSGLAYQGLSQVNWDPIDCTVLADEQVNEHGKSWRSGASVEKRFHRQWLIKTNAFAEDLYKGEDIIDTGHWNFILAHQRWWIKKPNGFLFYLNFDDQEKKTNNILLVFTAYPELFLSSKAFIGISKNHWLFKKSGNSTLSNFGQVSNPFLDNHRIDIRLMNDDVIMPKSTQATLFIRHEGFENEEKRNQVVLKARKQGLGGYYTSDTYRDWLISRQRFWGTPIPIIHCPDCGAVAENENNLPIELPKIDDTSKISRNQRHDDIISPLKFSAPKEWLQTRCPKCDSENAQRETDTCDTFFDSAWYFLRYFNKPVKDKPFDGQNLLPVHCYIGGKEHAALHLFYARFITHFLKNRNYINFREPFRTLLMQAIVKSRTYKWNGQYISANEAEEKTGVEVSFEKMSKSKGTGVNPNDLSLEYSMDAVRWTIISVGNPESERLWDTNEKEFYPTMIFFHRIFLTIEEYLAASTDSSKLKILERKNYNENLSKLSEAIDHTVFNVLYSLQSSYQIRNGTSSIHKLINALRSNIKNNIVLSDEFERGLISLLIILSPFVPCFASECWQALTNKRKTSKTTEILGVDFEKPVLEQKWPMIKNPEFPFIIKFTIKNQLGKEEECQRIKVPIKYFKTWQDQEIRNLLELKPEHVEWIEINKRCSIIIRLVNRKFIDENEKLKKLFQY